ncbi:MAG TPA: DNA mismatch repair protein MutS [Anaeromyxobacteraceae bacterium]|nr:DNA mismatch repair protein MutS [Anaeromyxobacteraceae bacterium]
MTPPSPSPIAELLRVRLEARRAALARLDTHDARYAAGRLAAFVALLAAGWLSLGSHRLSAAWLLLPALAYAALASFHDRALRARRRLRRAIAFHEAALARVEDRWAGLGNPGDRFASPGHPYSADLDLFGRGSLFELLCTARTRGGEEALAAFLLAPAEPEEVALRQTAARELAPRLDLAEDLAVLGDDVRAEIDPARLSRWGEAAAALPAFTAPAAALLALANLSLAVLWERVPLLPYAGGLSLLATWALQRLLRDRIAAVREAVDRPAAELRVVTGLLARLEAEPFEAARLADLRRRLVQPTPASRRVARLSRLAELFEWTHNELFALLGFFVCWKPLVAAAVERWRRANGPSLRGWLSAVAELEALAALGGFAREHPDFTFPRVEVGPAVFEARGLAHPLLGGEAVRNDLALAVRGGGAAPGQAPPQLLLVSGSNMSGKSTLLRTVGASAVLALAGAPVRARSLRLTPLAVGATLRIQDSLQAGRSRFYAEITRLKELMDLARGPRPLLFLLDEILHGTNSHDRRVGAEAVVRELAARGAIGVVTTHDLTLTELGRSLAGAENAHFEDQVVDGRIAFDYRLRPGVVERSNALALMRAVGLEV